MKYCQKCGTKLRDEANFCYTCGTPCAKVEYVGSEIDVRFRGERRDQASEMNEVPENREIDEDEIPEEVVVYRDDRDFRDAEQEGGAAEDDDPAENDNVGDSDDVVDSNVDDDFDDDTDDSDDDDFDDDTDDSDDDDDSDEDDDDDAEEEDDEEELQYGQSRSSIIGPMICLLLIALLCVYFFLSPARRTTVLLMNNQTEQAAALYDSSVAGNPVEERVLKILAGFETGNIFRAYNSGRLSYESAEVYLEELSSYSDSALWKLNQLRTLKSSKDAYAAAVQYELSGDLRSAILAYQKVLSEDKNSKQASEALAAVIEKYRDQVLEKAAAAISGGNYPEALNELQAADAVIPNDTIITDRISETRLQYASSLKKESVPIAKSYIEDGYYKQALDLLKEAQTYNSDDRDITALIQTATSKYEDFVTEQVSIYIGNKDFDGAIDLISRALNDIPDDEVFVQLYKSVEQSRRS